MYNQKLKQAGLKATLPRMKILELLESSTQTHMNADAIYYTLAKAGEDIGIATVYRVLNQLEAARLVARHHFTEGGKAVYELATKTHHDHLMCRTCGAVIEFLDEALKKRQQKVVEKMGFQMTDYSLVIHADCTQHDCPNAKLGNKQIPLS